MVISTKSCKFLLTSTSFDAFQKMPYFLRLFTKDLFKTLKHNSFNQKFLVVGETDKFSWLFTKCHTFLNFLLNSWSKPQNIVVSTKSSQLWRDRHLLMVFNKMPYFLNLFSKNLIKTLKHDSLHQKMLVLARSTSFDGF